MDEQTQAPVRNMLVEMPKEEAGEWTFMDDGKIVKVVSPSSFRYFSTSGCKCHPVLVIAAHAIFVGGADDCPVHGFKVGWTPF